MCFEEGLSAFSLVVNHSNLSERVGNRGERKMGREGGREREREREISYLVILSPNAQICHS